MTIFAVPAARDPRVAEILRPADGIWTAALTRLSPEEADTLCLVSAVLCPHSWLAVDSYRAVVLAIDRHIAILPADADAVGSLIARVSSWNGVAFAALSPGNRTKAVAAHSGSPAFLTTLRLVCRHLYDLPEVWSACGYDGAAGCAGGEPRSDFDDGPLPEDG